MYLETFHCPVTLLNELSNNFSYIFFFFCSPHFEFYDSSYSPPPRDFVFSPFRPSQRFSFNVEEVSPDEPVQVEQLQELARRTFGLTKRQYISLEKNIREKLQPKTSDRVCKETILLCCFPTVILFLEIS